jgi:G:T-mismatch repair DNA endonuclease (very short patch repair protein)
MLKIKFNKEELKRKYIDEGKLQWQLAEEYGCAVSVICTNLKDFGIKARPKCTPRFINLIKKEELEKRYLDAEPIDKLAISYGVSEGTIMRYLKDYGIPLHGRKGKYSRWFGKKSPESGNRLKNQWKDPIFRAKALAAPLTKEAQERNKLAKQAFWKSEDGLKLRTRFSIVRKELAKQQPEIFIERGKMGQRACPRISSVEIKVCELLKQLNIKHIQQYGYKLGIADIFISPNKIIFVNGDYWHNYPKGTDKDKRQIKYLKDNGYEVLIVWEHELKDMVKLREKVINYINKNVVVSALAKMNILVK